VNDVPVWPFDASWVGELPHLDLLTSRRHDVVSCLNAGRGELAIPEGGDKMLREFGQRIAVSTVLVRDVTAVADGALR
jgi:hypothetical protein